jgi:hypothetical protein
MPVKIFDTYALQTDVLFNTNNRTTLEKKTKINSRHPPFILTLPYATHSVGGGSSRKPSLSPPPGRRRRHPLPSPTAYDVGFLSVFP